jgi:hypothetical protein
MRMGGTSTDPLRKPSKGGHAGRPCILPQSFMTILIMSC